MTIDFNADPEKLAKESIDDFAAIKPIGSYYPYKDYVPALLDALREHSHRKQSP